MSLSLVNLGSRKAADDVGRVWNVQRAESTGDGGAGAGARQAHCAEAVADRVLDGIVTRPHGAISRLRRVIHAMI